MFERLRLSGGRGVCYTSFKAYISNISSFGQSSGILGHFRKSMLDIQWKMRAGDFWMAPVQKDNAAAGDCKGYSGGIGGE